MFDIIIVGLGPAGSTLARLLSSSLKVAVIDKKSLDGSSCFEKPCGGLLSPDAQKIIAKLGLSFPRDIMSDPQIFAVHTIDLKENLEKYYQRAYLNFNRHKFDLWLASLVPSGVKVFDNAVCENIEKSGDGFKVTYKKDGKTATISSKYIVGADGANSIVRKRFFNTPIRQYISIQHSFKIYDYTLPYYTCFFSPAYTDCYGWINMKDKYLQLGAALNMKNSRSTFEQILAHMKRLGYPLENPEKIEACLVNRPGSIKEIELGSGGVFLIGESAGLISPSSLEGISYAMESGIILAEVLNSGAKDPNKLYRSMSRHLKFKIFLKILKSPFMYFPPLRKLVMKSGISSIKILKK